MPNRYKTIRFSEFKNGETQKDHSDNPDLAFSNRLALNENKKVRLAPLFGGYTIADSYFYSTDDKIWGEYNDTGVIYFFIVTKVGGVDHACLYSSNGSAAPTLQKDFGAGLPEQIIFSHDHIIVQFINDTSGVLEWYWSKTPTVGASWTNIASMDDQLMIDWAINDNTIYAACYPAGGTLASKKSDIFVSTDEGETFTAFQSGAPVQKLVSSNGFLYGYTTKGKLQVLENNTWRVIDPAIAQGTLHDVNGTLRQFGFDGYAYTFDGISLARGRQVLPNDRPYLSGVTKNESLFHYFIEATNSYRVYSYDTNNVILNFAEFENLPDGDIFWGIIKSTENVYFALVNDDNDQNVQLFSTYSGQYEDAGNYESTIIDEGEITPKQIVLKHDPLPANTSVKVYHKANKASSYTLILTSDTDDAIKKTYNYANGLKYDFLQFKVELLTSNATVTPDNISVDFSFVPIGLQNAK